MGMAKYRQNLNSIESAKKADAENETIYHTNLLALGELEPLLPKEIYDDVFKYITLQKSNVSLLKEETEAQEKKRDNYLNACLAYCIKNIPNYAIDVKSCIPTAETHCEIEATKKIQGTKIICPGCDNCEDGDNTWTVGEGRCSGGRRISASWEFKVENGMLVTDYFKTETY